MGREILVYARYRKGVYVELVESMKDSLLHLGFDAVTGYESGRPPQGYDFIIEIVSKFDNRPHSEISVFVEIDHIDLEGHKKVDYAAFTRSLHIFDYKRDLTRENIYYCPIGYSKHFDTAALRVDLRDSFHMGVSRSRRGLRYRFRHKHNLWTTHDRRYVFGEERDEFIVTSKINVNTRPFVDYWFTPLHAALVLFKGKLYMQEDMGKDDYNWYKQYMVLFTEENFQEKYDYWLSHDRERREFEQFVHEDIKKNHPFEKYFYAAMGDLLEDYR